jgi:metal-responsive CopG/Arc/MetJ family transcriptional regulator
MSQKSEIKVYLPLKLIGQLEGRKQLGMRSRFIEDAIQEKLRRQEEASLMDWPIIVLLCNARERMDLDTGYSKIYRTLLQLVIDEVLE